MTKLIIAFRSFAKAPNHSTSQRMCSSTNYSPYQHKVFFQKFIRRAHTNVSNIYLAHSPLCAPFLVPPLGDHSDRSVTNFSLYKTSRNKYGCTAIMMRLKKKKCVYSGQKIPWGGGKYITSRATSSDDKDKTEGSLWSFTYTFQLRNYCKYTLKKFCKYNIFFSTKHNPHITLRYNRWSQEK